MIRTFSREVRLASRPVGMPSPANFELVRVEVPPLENHQVLVRNTFMSVDPYMKAVEGDPMSRPSQSARGSAARPSEKSSSRGTASSSRATP